MVEWIKGAAKGAWAWVALVGGLVATILLSLLGIAWYQRRRAEVAKIDAERDRFLAAEAASTADLARVAAEGRLEVERMAPRVRPVPADDDERRTRWARLRGRGDGET